jgi:hypothetical protein
MNTSGDGKEEHGNLTAVSFSVVWLPIWVNISVYIHIHSDWYVKKMKLQKFRKH